VSEAIHMIIEREDLRNRAHVFRDRAHAGAVLAEMLAPSFDRRPHAIVLAIPAGGVPVAAPIARRLALPLELAVVSKITLAWNPEAGYGAVAFDGSACLNDALLREIGLSETEVEAGVARTREKVARRNAALRENRDFAAVTGSDVVLVDDGLASGFTLRAAVAALRATGAATISVAVPTAHESSARTVAASVEAFYCPNVRAGHRYAVADAYMKWSDVDEETVRALLVTFRPAAPS
jgi:putative phosphoribosyl transferase